MDNLARILLVDDDAGVIEFLTAALRGEAAMESVSTAEQALDRIRQTPFDVILTDIRMPGMGGLELLRRASALQPATRIIVMTGDAEPDTIAESLRRSAFCYLVKPFSVSALKDAVRNAVQSSNGHDDVRILSSKPDWIALSLRCKLEIADRILSFLRAMGVGLSDQEQDHMATVFRELLVNAIEHGGHSDPEKRVELLCVRTATAIIYYLRDPGEGFSFDNIPHAAVSNDPSDPVAHTEVRHQMGIRPGGFGLLLTRRLADELIYNEKGNEVMVVKYVKAKKRDA